MGETPLGFYFNAMKTLERIAVVIVYIIIVAILNKLFGFLGLIGISMVIYTSVFSESDMEDEDNSENPFVYILTAIFIVILPGLYCYHLYTEYTSFKESMKEIWDTLKRIFTDIINVNL